MDLVQLIKRRDFLLVDQSMAVQRDFNTLFKFPTVPSEALRIINFGYFRRIGRSPVEINGNPIETPTKTLPVARRVTA